MMMRWFIRITAHKNLDEHFDALGQEFSGQGEPRDPLQTPKLTKTRV